jgi:thiol peroxidase
MATTKFKGQDVELLGNEVNVGDKAPEVTVVKV